ncbi:MAG: CHAT domain-containing protein/tetratricopeptide (TPR) repeat protein [Cyclobacteriaceae bacterium]
MKVLFLISFSLLSYSIQAQDWLVQYNLSLEAYDNYELKQSKAYGQTALTMFQNEVTTPHKNVAAIQRHLSVVCYELFEVDDAVTFATAEIETLQALGLDMEDTYATALANLALIRSSRSEYEEAERLLTAALALSEDLYGPGSVEVAINQGNLGVSLFQLKQDDRAEQLLLSSMEVLEQALEIPYDYYNILYNYSSLQASKGNFAAALDGYQVLEEGYAYDAPNFEYGAILIKVGDALDNLGRYSEAVGKYRTALSTLTDIGEDQSLEFTIAENNLSIDLQKVGAYEEAQHLLSDTYASRLVKKEEDPESFVYTAFNYGNLLIQQQEWAKALEILKEVKSTYSGLGLIKDLTYINTLEGISKIGLSQGNLDLAYEEISLAIAEANQQKQTAKLYSLYNQQSKTLSRQGKYIDAQSTAQKAVNQSTETFGGQSIQSAFAKNTFAGILTEVGQYDQAEKVYAEAMPIFAKAYGTKHPEYGTILSNYSSLLQLQGKYYAAQSYLIDAVGIKKAAYGPENLDYLTTYENLGMLYSATARYIDAEKILTEVNGTKERLLESTDPSLAYTYVNLGNIKKLIAEYPEAEEYFLKAKEIYEASLGNQHVLYGAAINNLALLYQKMGNVNAAKPLFTEALSVYEKTVGKFTPDYAAALSNLASLYQLERNTEKAKTTLEQVLEIDKEILGENHPSYAKTLNNLAALYESTQAYDEAKEAYLLTLKIYKNTFGESHPSYALTLYNLAVLEQALENLDQAKIYYEKVVTIRRTILGENHPDYTYSIYGLASISQKTGDFETARENYKIVISKYLEDIQKYFPSLSENEKSAFYSKIKPIFDAYMDFSIEYVGRSYGDESTRNALLGEIYDLQLATKALLLNATNKVRNRILSSGDQQLIQLFQDWIALKENIVKSLALSKDEIVQNNIDIPAMEDKSNTMEKELSLKSSLFASEFEKSRNTWRDIKATLGDQEAAIEVIRIRKNLKNDSILYANLIVSPQSTDAPKLVLISNGDELEGKGFKTYKNSIVYKIEDKKSYNQFWKAIDEALPKNTSNVYLSADGIFNKVNIATLFDPEEEQYVIDKYTIRLLSNTKELVAAPEPQNPNNTAQVFGYPAYNLANTVIADAGGVADTEGMRYSFGDNVSELPGTLVELNNITDIMTQKSWQYSSFTRDQASEVNIKKMQSPKIFHVATHGFFLEDIPLSEEDNEGLGSRSQKYNPLMRSGLLFAGSENTIRNEDIPGDEDGILTAYEAMNLNLDNTDIVVMSACETGLGEVKNGEGVYGLQRSFLVAGAQNLIMSLWKVNDETTQLLMSEFYNQWFSGKTKTDAFNEAILSVKKDYPKPYFWGAFVILGK